MSILRVQVHNTLIVRALTKGETFMHDITDGLPSGCILTNIEYKIPSSIFWFVTGYTNDDEIEDVKVTYAPIKILE